ncbi:MAG: radical SAM protein, partial [Clostridia bacterium]|nr:radical SAM protein [Clostridia bacterium]
PYMDVPIQHIADSVLARMNRHGDGATVKDAIARLRREVPGITLRTTAMVGFPGETEEDFTELCAFIKEARFDRFGAFTFSPEEGTPAAEMEGQVEEDVKALRHETLMTIQLDISAELQREKVGETVTVLCEGFDPVAETHFGRSAADAPDVDGKIYFSAKKRVPAGEFVQVKITEALDYDLIGVLA